MLKNSDLSILVLHKGLVIRCQGRTTRWKAQQIDALSDPKCSWLNRYVRARIVMVESDPFLAVNFTDFLTNSCVPLRINCPALF